MNKPTIILIAGKARAGKDTLGEQIKYSIKERGNNVKLIHFADPLKHMAMTYFGWNGYKNEIGRTLLQRLGTECGRNIREDFWTSKAIDTVNLMFEFYDKLDYVIVPDCRFPNEISCWESEGFATKTIYVYRNIENKELNEEQKSHASEKGFADTDISKFDFVISNNESIENLYAKVDDIVKCICSEKERKDES